MDFTQSTTSISFSQYLARHEAERGYKPSSSTNKATDFINKHKTPEDRYRALSYCGGSSSISDGSSFSTGTSTGAYCTSGWLTPH